MSSIVLLPANRQIVHHVLIFTDTTGTAAKMDGQDGNQGYDCFGGPGIPIDNSTPLSSLDALSGVAGWAPGTRPHFLPDGIGIVIKANPPILLPLHFPPHL